MREARELQSDNRPSRIAWLLPAALAIVVAGCASTTRETPQPEVDLPSDWTAAPADAGPRQDIAADWWTTFGDARLDELVDEALASNHDLTAAAARVDAAVAQARIAGADLAPQVGLGVDGSRGKQVFVGLPIPGNEGQALSSTTTTYGSALNISWEVDLWGRIRAGRDAARSDVKARASDLDAARLSVAGQTAKAWFAILEAKAQVDLAEKTLASRTLTRRRIERRYRSGVRTALELRLSMANEAATRAELAGRRRQLDAARRQLELLLARYPAGRIEVEEGAPLPTVPQALPAGLPAELVARRPDLVAQEYRLEAAGFSIHQARASLYPRLSLTGSAGRLSGEIEDLLEDDFSIWSLAANLLQPLYQGGRLRAGVDLAEARYQELAEGYAQRVLRAFAEVEQSLIAEELLAEQERALDEAARQSAAAQRLAEDRYDSGLVDYLSVLESQREANLAMARYIEVRRSLLDARVDLYLSLGGSFDQEG